MRIRGVLIFFMPLASAIKVFDKYFLLCYYRLISSYSTQRVLHIAVKGFVGRVMYSATFITESAHSCRLCLLFQSFLLARLRLVILRDTRNKPQHVTCALLCFIFALRL
jgi:hypothetical protein